MISWLRFRRKIEKLFKKKSKKKRPGELDEEFKKRMKDAYDTGLQQGLIWRTK
ncbi:MAG: hypothetical protein KAS63_05790 [Candidatus Heimdallarchaeota archaeon]|nr:hypothetical protein [Candidatus Heimdallarchaeota archaeon]MCK4954851.1 hypothetical protein [Candidatus Heimdallarchaeota archaeon]